MEQNHCSWGPDPPPRIRYCFYFLVGGEARGKPSKLRTVMDKFQRDINIYKLISIWASYKFGVTRPKGQMDANS